MNFLNFTTFHSLIFLLTCSHAWGSAMNIFPDNNCYLSFHKTLPFFFANKTIFEIFEIVNFYFLPRKMDPIYENPSCLYQEIVNAYKRKYEVHISIQIIGKRAAELLATEMKHNKQIKKYIKSAPNLTKSTFKQMKLFFTKTLLLSPSLQSWTLNQWTFYNFSGISYHKQNWRKLLYIKFINL